MQILPDRAEEFKYQVLQDKVFVKRIVPAASSRMVFHLPAIHSSGTVIFITV
jgi:hypothetical protein